MRREVVQSLWIGEALSPLEAMSISSYLRLGHAFRLYVYSDVSGVPGGVAMADARSILPPPEGELLATLGTPAPFADVFRYALLFEEGGWWTDLDMICLRPLPRRSPYVFASERTPDGSTQLNGNVIRTPARSEAMRACRDRAAATLHSAMRWGQIGPELLTKTVTEVGLGRHVVPWYAFNPVDWWRSDALVATDLRARVVAMRLADPRVRGLHLWNERWKLARLDKWSQYPASTVYGRLQRRFGIRVYAPPARAARGPTTEEDRVESAPGVQRANEGFALKIEGVSVLVLRGLRRLRREVRRAVSRSDVHPETVILVASSPRSGSTWLAELIDHRRRFRLVFEPFLPGRVPIVSHFVSDQYVVRSSADPRFLGPAEEILSGRYRNRWIDHRSYCASSSTLLVKDVRANLMLAWIKERFPRVRLVWLLRHPCAVAQSALSLGWDYPLTGLLSQPSLPAQWRELAEQLLRRHNSAWGRKIVEWCIENVIPRQELRPGEAHVVFYELLCTQPEMILRNVTEYLGLPWERRMLARIGLPSAVSRIEGGRKDPSDSIDAWRSRVSQAELQTALEILRAFGLDDIYGSDSMPRQTVILG